jgi:hypothetical protein
MIEPMPAGRRVPKAKVICDDCGREEVFACDYDKSGSPNEAQARRKAQSLGWAYVKRKLRCLSCEAKRKTTEKESDVQISAKPREPDGKQKRLIILALEDAYDDKARRYKGGETDKTIAEDLGGGIMPGWVAVIRADMFGPAGNEEVDRLHSEIEAFRAEVNDKLRDMENRLKKAVETHDRRVKA